VLGNMQSTRCFNTTKEKPNVSGYTFANRVINWDVTCFQIFKNGEDFCKYDSGCISGVEW
jgi:hypothetical protein